MANSCPWAYLSNSNLQFTNYFLTNETQHRKAIKSEKRLKDKCLLIAIKLSSLMRVPSSNMSKESVITCYENGHLNCEDCPRKFITKCGLKIHISKEHIKDSEIKVEQLHTIHTFLSWCCLIVLDCTTLHLNSNSKIFIFIFKFKYFKY